MRILLAEDDATLRNLLSSILRKWDYDVVVAENGEAALAVMSKPNPPRMALLDWAMPIIDGVEVCHILRHKIQKELGNYIHIIMLTHHDAPSSVAAALEAGANDFIKKPAEPLELRSRLEVGKRMLEYETALLSKVREERLDCFRNLTVLAEERDNTGVSHMRRVAMYAELISQRRNLAPEFTNAIRTFAEFHDIGKIGVPIDILATPGKLSAEAFETVKTHTTLGYQIMTNNPDMVMAAEICLTHHEKWDGTGYPHRLANLDIPIPGRIVGLAEVYDALRSRRPYKAPWSHADTLQTIVDSAGSHFDPVMVDAFVNAEDDILEIGEEAQYPGGDYC